MKHNYPSLMRKLVLLVCALWALGSAATATAQTYNMPAVGNDAFTTCAGTLYDNGGPTAGYTSNANGLTTITPATAGSKVRLTFNSFQLDFSDNLVIYDGTNTTAPIIGSYFGSNTPGTVYGTSSSGALTLRLIGNNFGVQPGFSASIACVTTVPQPDLTLQGISAFPTSVAPGGTIQANCSIQNLSGASASSSNVGYYLSTNATLDASDQLLGTITGGTLPVGVSSSRNGFLQIGFNVSPGSYFLLYVADPQGQVNESNEQNNLASVAITVTAPSFDLVIQQQGISSTSVTPGSSLSMGCNIVNLGSATAPSSSVGYYLSTNTTLDAGDALLTSSFGGALAPGSFGASRFATTTIPNGTAPGSYFVLFVADFQNQVGETNEQNNVASSAITVTTPSVDLVVLQPSLFQTTMTPGSFNQTNAVVQNFGNTFAGSSNLGYFLSTNSTLDASDVLLSSSFVGSLGGGNSTFISGQFSLPTTTAPGSYFVLFVADYQNTVSETNEQNNVVGTAITVAPPTVDLVVQQPSLFPASTTAGSQVQVSATVRNLGNSLAGSSSLGYYLSTNSTFDASDVLLGSSLLNPIGGNSSVFPNNQITLPAATTPGSYFVLFVADRLNQVPETNEQNNVVSLPFTVLVPNADLVIIQPGLAAPTGTPGSFIATSCSVLNQGTTLTGFSEVGYYLSTNSTFDAGDMLLGSASIGALAGGVSTFRQLSVPIPSGTALGNYFVLFVADQLNSVPETNEQNNVSSVPLTLTPARPDYAVLQQGLSRASSPAGGGVSGGAFVFNPGTATAPANSLGLYLSTDNQFSSNDVLLTSSSFPSISPQGGLNVGANFTVPATTTPGSYFVLFVADASNQVVEASELNNVASVPLLITAPFNGTVVPFTGAQTITTCNTTVYDNGGTSDYAAFSNGQLTILPATSGARVRLTLNFFSVESGFDYLQVYDGTSVNSPRIATYTGTLPAGTVLTATNSAGALTLVFTSDDIIEGAGFEAVVTCVGGTQGPPDLIAQQVSAAPSTISTGAFLNVSGTIRNQGNGDAASSALGYYLSANTTLDASDALLGTTPGGLLNAGTNAGRGNSFMVPTTLAPGAYFLLAVADPLNAVTESNEQNNVTASTSTITVTTGGADLTVSQLTTLPAQPVIGGPLSVTCFELNQGTAAAAAHNVGVYLSTDATWSANDVLLNTTNVTSMNPNFGTTRVISGMTVPAATPPGPYYLLFVTDPQNTVVESNEQNNVASRLVQVIVNSTRREQAGGYAISLLPNPTASGSFEARFDGQGVTAPVALTLLNSLGQVVSQQTLTLRGLTTKAVFSTRGLSRGVYTLRVNGQDMHATRRVVVE